MYVHHLLAWCSQRSEEGIQSLRTTITDVCKSLCGSLQEEQVLLTNELSLYLSKLYFFPIEIFFLAVYCYHGFPSIILLPDHLQLQTHPSNSMPFSHFLGKRLAIKKESKRWLRG